MNGRVVAHQGTRPARWLWRKTPLAILLWPISLLFCALVWLRVRLYRWNLLQSRKLPVTVVVVGNISLGGNGKTPFVVSLVHLLQQNGYHPGILTRGYKSDVEQQTTLLAAGETAARVGDEANMLSTLCQCPLAVGADRAAGGSALLQRFDDIDVLVADDGLQHYALARDVEIIVQRKAANGNGFCLPAGPLREPKSRLQRADLVVDRDSSALTEVNGQCWNLLHPTQRKPLSDFSGQALSALAGIGFPELFFAALEQRGLDIEGHAFEDHHSFEVAEVQCLLEKPLLVTHKDAVKLEKLVQTRQWDNIWVVPLELRLSDDLQYRLLTLIEKKHHG